MFEWIIGPSQPPNGWFQRRRWGRQDTFAQKLFCWLAAHTLKRQSRCPLQHSLAGGSLPSNRMNWTSQLLANDVGRSPLLEQDTLARKRLLLDWQGADGYCHTP